MRKLVTLVCIFYISLMSFAQNVTMNDSLNKTGCNFVVYDNGGINGDYGINRNDILVLNSNNSSAASVEIRILLQGDFDVHPSDTLYIYDGPNTNSPLLDKLNNAIIGGISANDLVYTATVTNTSGALTLKFVSDASDTTVGTGFIINTSCVAPCQRVNLAIDSVHSSHIPHQDVDGFFYVDLCPWDTAHLVVKGVYPDNGHSYVQDDAHTHFYWDMSLEELDGVGMNAVDYYFETGRGYDVSITATDSAGCENKMPVIFRVRTSDNPIRAVNQLPPMCSGNEITIDATYSNLSVVQIDSVYSQQLTTMKVTDTIFLPDGVDCGSGCAYQSPVTFTAFSPTATIQSADDILYVRAKLEHSFIGDIYIGLECPSGQKATLLKKYGTSGSANCSGTIPVSAWGWNGTGSTGAYFGDPVDDSGGGCTPTPMGTAWNYCWSNNTDPNYGYQYAGGQGYVYESVNITNNHIDSTNTTNMTQVYHPEDPFSTLIGCPMNGTWAITVIDGWSIDNGYITEWEMALDPSLLPQDWNYAVHVDSIYVTGPGADGPYIIPDTAGSISYTIHLRDEFGCVYDTSMTIDILANPKPDIGPDVEICYGSMHELHANYDDSTAVYVWNTGEHGKDIFVASEGEYIVKITTSLPSGLTCKGADTVLVSVSPRPNPQFTASDTVGCMPMNIHFTNGSTADTASMSYQWTCWDQNWNIAFTSDQREPNFTFERDGIYTVRLVVRTNNGCLDSLIRWNYLTVNYQPTAEFVATPEVSLMSENNGMVNFMVLGDTSTFGEGMSFYWDFADGTIDSSAYNINHTFENWGDYDVKLHMSTPAGCANEITHTVVLEADLVFPNVITPNGDGVNDVFAIKNLNTSMNELDPDKYRQNELYIYDRWGKQVYKAENYDTFMKENELILGEKVFDGGNVNDGTYFFSFYYKGKYKTVNYHGTLEIIRNRK